MEAYIQNCNEFHCPMIFSHVMNSYANFKTHIHRCKNLKGKTLYICKFADFHCFLDSKERDVHQNLCVFYDENKVRFPNSQMFIGDKPAPLSNYFPSIKNHNQSQNRKRNNKEWTFQDAEYNQEEDVVFEKKFISITNEGKTDTQIEEIMKSVQSNEPIEQCIINDDELPLNKLDAEMLRQSNENSINILQQQLMSQYGPHNQLTQEYDLTIKPMFNTHIFSSSSSISQGTIASLQNEIKMKMYRKGKLDFIECQIVPIDDFKHVNLLLKHIQKLTYAEYLSILCGEFTVQEYNYAVYAALCEHLQDSLVGINLSNSQKNSNSEELLLIFTPKTKHLGRFLHKEGKIGVICLDKRRKHGNKEGERNASAWFTLQIQSQTSQANQLSLSKQQNETEETQRQKLEQQRQKQSELLLLQQEIRALERQKRADFEKMSSKVQNEEVELNKCKKRCEDAHRKHARAEMKKDSLQKQIQSTYSRKDTLKALAYEEYARLVRDYKMKLNSEYAVFTTNLDLSKGKDLTRLSDLMAQMADQKELVRFYADSNEKHAQNLQKLQKDSYRLQLQIDESSRASQELLNADQIKNMNMDMQQAASSNLNNNNHHHIEDNDAMCMLCGENRVRIVNQPCLHATHCKRCQKNSKIRSSINMCLICKVPIQNNIEIIIPKLIDYNAQQRIKQ